MTNNTQNINKSYCQHHHNRLC